MAVTYHVGKHEDGYGYRLEKIWSETFPDHDTAFAAARAAAERQHLEGQDAEISYQLPAVSWRVEHVDGRDRPDTEVVDDESGSA